MTGTEAARAARPFATNSVIRSLSWVPRSAASDLNCRNISSGRSIIAPMAMLLRDRIVASTHALGPRPAHAGRNLHALGPRPAPAGRNLHGLPRAAAAEDGRAPRRVEARFLTVSTPVPVPNARLRGPKMPCWCFGVPSDGWDAAIRGKMSAWTGKKCPAQPACRPFQPEKDIFPPRNTFLAEKRRIPERDCTLSRPKRHGAASKTRFFDRRSVFPDGKPTSDAQDRVLGRGDGFFSRTKRCFPWKPRSPGSFLPSSNRAPSPPSLHPVSF